MPSRMTREFIHGVYGQTHVRRVGSPMAGKLPIVFLHMSPKSGRLFSDVLNCLPEDRFGLAPDYPGMGESDAPPASPQVTIGDYAQHCWQALEAFDDRPCHLVGHHTGAMVAAEMAVMNLERVRSLVSISAPVLTDEETRAFDEAYQPIPIDEAGTRFATMWQRILEHRGPGMTLEDCAISLAENLRGGEAYEWGHRAAFAYAARYREVLSTLEQPVFVMNVRDDLWDITPRADDLLRRGERRDYPDWGHGFLKTQAQAVVNDITRFISVHDVWAHDVSAHDAATTDTD